MLFVTRPWPTTVDSSKRIKQTNIFAMMFARGTAPDSWAATKYLFSRGFMHD